MLVCKLNSDLVFSPLYAVDKADEDILILLSSGNKNSVHQIKVGTSVGGHT